MLRKTTVENGAVEGVIGNDPRVTVYKGIPFAAPPVGERRWRAPEPAENWTGTMRADTFAPMAIQNKPGANKEEFYAEEIHPSAEDYVMDEDCLYLNVWTPAKAADEKLPVYLWIHGGGYRSGYSYEMEFDGERMARRGIVFVTIAYRLNIFGFFAHPWLRAEAPDAPQGNQGLLDQLAAMQWVKRNIAAFGGDPDRITIGGQSAGAGAVLAQVISPMSQGLIAGAITQSGGGLRSIGYNRGWRSLTDAEAEGAAFLSHLGITSLQQARELPAMALWGAFEGYRDHIQTQPTIDGKFLLEDSTDAIIHGRYADIPYLFGYTSGEGPGGPAAPAIPQSVADFEAQMRQRYGEDADAFLALANVKTMDDLYALMKNPSFNTRAVASELYADVQARQGRKGYLYCFDHEMPGDDMGCYHGAELWFVFDSVAKCRRPFKGKHYDLSRQVCNYWCNFVKTGDPNGPDADGQPMPYWAPYTAEEAFRMRFGDVPAQDTAATDPVMAFCIKHFLAEIDKEMQQNP